MQMMHLNLSSNPLRIHQLSLLKMPLLEVGSNNNNNNNNNSQQVNRNTVEPQHYF